MEQNQNGTFVLVAKIDIQMSLKEMKYIGHCIQFITL